MLTPNNILFILLILVVHVFQVPCFRSPLVNVRRSRGESRKRTPYTIKALFCTDLRVSQRFVPSSGFETTDPKIDPLISPTIRHGRTDESEVEGVTISHRVPESVRFL